MDKYYLDKYLENLFKVRDLSTTLSIVLLSGALGVCLMYNSIHIAVIMALAPLGFCFFWVFFRNLVNANSEIGEILKDIKKGDS